MSPSWFDNWDADRFAADLSVAEENVSALSKLTAETLFLEIEALVEQLRPLVAQPEIHWPRISMICAELRGYAFNAFSITHSISRRELQKTSPPRPHPAPRPTIDDLLA